MTLLLLPVATSAEPVLMGDIVHVQVLGRAAGRRCSPLVVTEVFAASSGRTRPTLTGVDHTTDQAMARVRANGWPHTSERGSEPTSWHMRAECPEGS